MVEAKVPDVWYGGRIPVGNIKFLEPTYDEESSIYVSRYSVGTTVVFAVGSWQPIEVTFKTPEMRGLVGYLSDAMQMKPKLMEQSKAIGTVEYAICDWDDPSLDDNRGFIAVDSGRKVIRITIRTDPRNSGVNFGTREIRFELKPDVCAEFVRLLEEAISSSSFEEDGTSRELHPISNEELDQYRMETFPEKSASEGLKFLELTYKKDSEFLVGSTSDGTRIFVDVGLGESGLGADCDVQFNGQKKESFVQLLKRAVRIAGGVTEDWRRIGFAPYSMCDWDDLPPGDANGFVVIDARKGRIRLIIRADPRSDELDWPIVAHKDTVEELISVLGSA